MSVSRKSPFISRYIRFYATSGDLRRDRFAKLDPHTKFGLPPWPNSNNPSPKELFSFETLNTPDFDLRVKRIYQSYVKIYHPDVSKNVEIMDPVSNLPLTAELKRQRFDQVSNCYNILRDPLRRNAYWRFENSSTNYSQSTRSARPQTQLESSFQRYRKAAAGNRAYNFQNDEAFWKAATWEDYYRMRHKKEPPTAEEIEKNKYKILACVVFIGFLSTALQYIVAAKRTDDFHTQQALMNLKQEDHLNGSRNNFDYGEGSQPDRLKRFLILRRFNFFDKGDYEKHAKMKLEEEEILNEAR